MQHFRSLGNYTASDPTELTLLEGDVVKVMKTGSTGWWYAQHSITQQEGWVPSTYMEPLTDNSLSSISELPPFSLINSNMRCSTSLKTSQLTSLHSSKGKESVNNIGFP